MRLSYQHWIPWSAFACWGIFNDIPQRPPGESLQQLVGFLDEIHAKGVDLYLHQQNIDTSTPSGNAMFQMAGVFAEFERSMIQERVRAGLQRARAQGKVLGRPKVSARTETLIRQKRERGMGILKIAREIGAGTSVVQRVLSSD